MTSPQSGLDPDVTFAFVSVTVSRKLIEYLNYLIVLFSLPLIFLLIVSYRIVVWCAHPRLELTFPFVPCPAFRLPL